MIKANELRIGNWVRLFKGVDDNGAVWENYEISSGFDLYKLDENDCVDIQPIPIDELWLRRAGFARSKKGTFFSGKFVDIELFNGKFYPAIIGIRWDHKIESVHHLQNLFFALTGTELEFSEI